MKLQAFQKDVWGLHEAPSFRPALRSATVSCVNNSLTRSTAHLVLQVKRASRMRSCDHIRKSGDKRRFLRGRANSTALVHYPLILKGNFKLRNFLGQDAIIRLEG